jgi:hypothetical protein
MPDQIDRDADVMAAIALAIDFPDRCIQSIDLSKMEL